MAGAAVDADPTSPVAEGVNAQAAGKGDEAQTHLRAFMREGPQGLVPALKVLYDIHDAAEARNGELYALVAEMVDESQPLARWPWTATLLTATDRLRHNLQALTVAQARPSAAL